MIPRPRSSDILAGVALFVMLLVFLFLSGCTGATQDGRPVIQVTDHYAMVMKDTELTVSADRSLHRATVGIKVRWGK